jgi:transcriptional regulator with PAS, ATPase and Fis domain
MLDKEGKVNFINSIGARILNINPREAVGKYIGSLVDFEPVVLNVLETGQGYSDREYVIKSKRGMLHFVKTAVPLKDNNGCLEGVVDIFREIKQVRKLVNQMVGATASFTFEDIMGHSATIRESIRLGKIAANSFSNVLIQGESGTGKELLAQAIHKCGFRSNGPFVAINCGALPRNLVESELFGYEEGAFTGAKHGGRPGKFELAHGGTIFLDEIGDMPLDIQVRLLRVLQDKKIIRVGGQQYIDVDVRVIAATNKDLSQEVRDGNFRLDLYYRLNVLPIFAPPLRERQEDIMLLAEFFLKKICRQTGILPKKFSSAVANYFMKYEWPGNVRELENVVERAVNLCEKELIGMEFLPRGFNEKEIANPGLQVSLRDIERTTIVQTLEKTQGNISKTAKILGIGRNTLYSKVKEYDILISKYGCSGIEH